LFRSVAGGITAALLLLSPLALPTSSEFDVDALNHQVQDHEERITSLENRADQTEARVETHDQAIRQIQSASPAPAAPSAEPTPTATTPEQPAPPPSPPPAPRTIERVERYYNPGANGGPYTNCRYHWSDGYVQHADYSGDVECPPEPNN
jgi:TolA-binding protein